MNIRFKCSRCGSGIGLNFQTCRFSSKDCRCQSFTLGVEIRQSGNWRLADADTLRRHRIEQDMAIEAAMAEEKEKASQTTLPLFTLDMWR